LIYSTPQLLDPTISPHHQTGPHCPRDPLEVHSLHQHQPLAHHSLDRIQATQNWEHQPKPLPSGPPLWPSPIPLIPI